MQLNVNNKLDQIITNNTAIIVFNREISTMKFLLMLHAVLMAAVAEAFLLSPTTTSSRSATSSTTSTKLGLFGTGGGGGKVPKSPKERDNQAISAVKAAISKPKTKGLSLIECEFPPLKELNKLGDGSMRSANEVDQANLSFCKKLIQSVAPLPPPLGPKTWFLSSSASSNAFNGKAESILKGTSATLSSLRNGIPSQVGKGDICILVAPNGRTDYKAAQTLATEVNANVIIVNGLAKDQESVSGKATMAYFLKPLTYNSQVVGYLTRQYPQKWTVVDAVTQKALGSFMDDEILFGDSNTPDLRTPGRLVQKATDERAIAARQK